jgi:hypothetical protein
MPGEHEIRSEISSLYQSSKETGASTGSTKNVFPEPYATDLKRILESNPAIMPKNALEVLKLKYED